MMIYIYDVRTLFESVGCTNYPRGGLSRPDKMITLYTLPFTYHINLTTLKSLSRGSVSQRSIKH